MTLSPLKNDPRDNYENDAPLLNAVAAHMITFHDPHRWPTLPDTQQAILETALELYVEVCHMEDALARTIGMTPMQIRTRTYQVAKDPATWNIDGQLADFVRALDAWVRRSV